MAGAGALYAAGRRLGEERSRRLLCRLPLVNDDDLDGAFDWRLPPGAPVAQRRPYSDVLDLALVVVAVGHVARFVWHRRDRIGA